MRHSFDRLIFVSTKTRFLQLETSQLVPPYILFVPSLVLCESLSLSLSLSLDKVGHLHILLREINLRDCAKDTHTRNRAQF